MKRHEDHATFDEAFRLFWKSRELIEKLLAMFSLGLLTWLGLWLLNVPYPLAFGVFTGVVAIAAPARAA